MPEPPKRRRSGGQRTGAKRQDALRARARDANLRRVEVWVPDGTQDQIRALAAQLRAAK